MAVPVIAYENPHLPPASELAVSAAAIPPAGSTSPLLNRIKNIANAPASRHPLSPAKASAVADCFLSELTARLTLRHSAAVPATRQDDSALSAWQRELFEQKAHYLRLAPERALAEAKENARVAVALDAERAAQARSEAEKAKKALPALALFTLDACGIPLPPPPPPAAIAPATNQLKNSPSLSPVNIALTMKSAQDRLIEELTSALAARIDSPAAPDPAASECALPAWKSELAQQKREYALLAPEREAADAREDARVAAAISAEAAEMARKHATVLEEKAPPQPLARDASGIPLPPPLPAFLAG